MRHGVDFSWSRPDPAELVAAGATFAIRYASNDHRLLGGSVEKNLNLDEAYALRRAGLDIVLVWEGVAADRDPLKGYLKGVADGRAATAFALTVGAPGRVPIYFAVDWDVTVGELPLIAEYFRGVAAVIGLDQVGVYGSYKIIKYLFDIGKVRFGWQSYAWSTVADSDGADPYLHWDERAQLRQVLNNQRVAGGTVDLDDARADQFGQWSVSMTYAPQDLLNVRAYLQAKTGLDAASLGIAGDAAHASSGGYHEGRDDLASVGSLNTDYSVVESSRDANPTNAASAFDLASFNVSGPAGTLDRHAVTRAVLDALNAGDPRTADIREMIYSLDDVNVHRWDRLGIRTTGDSSHQWHTHFSFFRDSFGRRDRDDNFMGLLKEFFGDLFAPSGEDDEEMSTGKIPIGFAFGGAAGRQDDLVAGLGMGPVNGGQFGNKRVVLGLSADFTPAAGVKLRIATKADGKAWAVQTVTIKAADDRYPIWLPDGCTKITAGRMKRDTGDQDVITKPDGTISVTGDAATCPVWWDLEFEKR